MGIKNILAYLADPKAIKSVEDQKILCDILEKDFPAFGEAWGKVSYDDRSAIIDDLVNQQDRLRTDEIGLAIFQFEPDPGLKGQVIQMLDIQESKTAFDAVIEAAQHAKTRELRVGAINQLAFIMQDLEIEEIDPKIGEFALNVLLGMKKDPDEEIQQAALIAAACLTHDETTKWIKEAFNRKSNDWQEAALWAAANNLNSEWESRVIDGLYSKVGGIRQAAIVGAGMMSLGKSRERLIELLDEEEGSDLFEEVIYALAKVGGNDVQTIFEAIIANTEDPELIELVNDAILELEFNDPEEFMRTHGPEFDYDEDGETIDDDEDEEDE